MIDKLEVGKTYRLIHKVGYFNNRYFNQQHYDHLFEKGCITLDKVHIQGGGMCKMRNVISTYEYKFFELVKDTGETK
jgi:hypothetical protein